MSEKKSINIHWALGLVLGMVLLSARVSAQSRDVQNYIEEKANLVLSQRLDPKLYVVFVTAESSSEEPVTDKKIVDLPFSPFKVDAKLLNDSPSKNDGPLDLKKHAFVITLIFDESIDVKIQNTFAEILRERFFIDNKNRQIILKKAKLYSEPGKNNAINIPVNIKDKLESDIATSKLETERQRLEGTKKEIEFQRKLNEIERALQTEKETAARTLAKKEAEQTASKAEKSKEKNPPKVEDKAPTSTWLSTLSSIQILIIGVLGVLALFGGTLLFGRALMKSMAAIGEGIKSAGAGIGAAMTPKPQPQNLGSEFGRPEPKKVDVKPAVSVDEKSAGWSPGQKDYDNFINMIQEKIELLNADKNLSLRQVLADLLETESGVEMAASVILALNVDSVRLLINDLPSQAVARLKAFLESPDAVTRAKSSRLTALQQFYGKIAAAEFVDSPLSKLRNLTWLTRMNSSEMATFLLGLPEDEQPVFLAFFSPFRISKIVEATTGDNRPKIIRMVAKVGAVTEEDVNKFVASRENLANTESLSARSKLIVDRMQYLGELVNNLPAEDQKVLLNAVEKDQAAYAFLSRQFLPFEVILSCAAEIVVEIFEGRTPAQVAEILFAADVGIQQHVIGSLPKVRGQAITDEIKVMLGKTGMAARYRSLSLRLQAEVAKYILRLANEGVLDIETLLAPPKTSPSAVTENSRAPVQGAA